MQPNPQYHASDGSKWILVEQRRAAWEAAMFEEGSAGRFDAVLFGRSAAELERKIEAFIATGGRRANPPSGLTPKGERMYEHVKQSYRTHGRRSLAEARRLAAQTVTARASEHPEWGLAQHGYHGNPDSAPQFDAARDSFEDFHDFSMRGSGRFKREIVVPERMALAGRCRFVTYRSDKWADGTHDYIHKITSFPKVKLAVDGEDTGRTVAIPKRARESVTVSLIGRALGFGVELPDGEEIEGTFPASAEWYWSPTARALYAVQAKGTLLAVVWGGSLDVEPRGIVG